MRKLYVLVLLVASLAPGIRADIIYGKPGPGMAQPTKPSSSASTPTVVVADTNGNEMLNEAESGYGPYSAQGHDGGDIAVVVTGGYKVTDGNHHSHGVPQGIVNHGHRVNAYDHSHGVPQGIVNHGHRLNAYDPSHGVPQGIVNHGHRVNAYDHSHGVQLPHGVAHGIVNHGGLKHHHHHHHGIGHYGHHHHHGVYQRPQGYGLHVPSHGLYGHHRNHGYGHPPIRHGYSGFKPIIGHSHGYAYTHPGHGHPNHHHGPHAHHHHGHHGHAHGHQPYHQHHQHQHQHQHGGYSTGLLGISHSHGLLGHGGLAYLG